MKACTKCGEIKSLSEFSHRTLPSGRAGKGSRCLECNRNARRVWYAENQEREQAKAVAYHHAHRETILPKQAAYRATAAGRAVKARLERERKIVAKRGSLLGRGCVKVAAIYQHAADVTELTGVSHQVDHIVPLLGRNVCGLHVWWNLQVITEDDNRRKGNRS